MPLKLSENSLGEQKHGHMLNGKCRKSMPYKNSVYIYIYVYLDTCIHIKNEAGRPPECSFLLIYEIEISQVITSFHYHIKT